MKSGDGRGDRPGGARSDTDTAAGRFFHRTPYIPLMAIIKNPATRVAEEKRRARAAQIRAGQIPGLFERGSKKVRPEIRTLIDEALARRATESAKTEN